MQKYTINLFKMVGIKENKRKVVYYANSNYRKLNNCANYNIGFLSLIFLYYFKNKNNTKTNNPITKQ